MSGVECDGGECGAEVSSSVVTVTCDEESEDKVLVSELKITPRGFGYLYERRRRRPRTRDPPPRPPPHADPA